MQDDGESIGLFEPLMISEGAKQRPHLNDLALELAEKSAALGSSLHESVAASLSSLMRSMNCYYSNLIEGHSTHPVDIERALENDYSTDLEKRNLQLEAKAHISVQQWIDDGGLKQPPTCLASLIEIHQRFCELLPQDLLWVQYRQTGKRVKVVPGKLRELHVEVGRHVAISPGAVPRFLERMHIAYARAGRIEAILAAACAHHRLLWVHPFMDGNGRVARLMSYAMLRHSLDTRGLWSIARGLARREQDYKAHLQACDERRRGDLDGRGTLSEAALASFTEFFLQTSIDQVEFMRSLVHAERLHHRIMIWVEEEMRAKKLPKKSDLVLKAILHQGELGRGEVVSILGANERTSRRVTSALLNAGVLRSESTRAPLKLAFPSKYAHRWLPGLFPEASNDA